MFRIEKKSECVHFSFSWTHSLTKMMTKENDPIWYNLYSTMNVIKRIDINHGCVVSRGKFRQIYQSFSISFCLRKSQFRNWADEFRFFCTWILFIICFFLLLRTHNLLILLGTAIYEKQTTQKRIYESIHITYE